MRNGLLAPLLVLAACSPPPAEPLRLVVSATKFGHGLDVRGGRVAWLDGAEASTDQRSVGVDVRVNEVGGAPLLTARSLGAVRGLVLLEQGVATLEFAETFLDQRVVLRPLDGSAARFPSIEDVPLALAANGDGLAWIEAGVQQLVDRDGDGTLDTNLLRVTLVLTDREGGSQQRRRLTIDGGLRSPASLFAPYPNPFGLHVTADAVWLGWGPSPCLGGSEVLRIDQTSGATTRVWEGGVPGANLAKHPEAFLVQPSGLTVAGSLHECGTQSATEGFLDRGGETTRFPKPLVSVAGDESVIWAAEPGRVLEVAGEQPGITLRDRLGGLDLEAGRPFIATTAGVYEVRR